jgi:hypothetical protein
MWLRGFHLLFREKLSSSLMLLGMKLDLCCFPGYLVCACRLAPWILVSCSWMLWLRFMLCSAMADLSGWLRWLCQCWCFSLAAVEHMLCSVYSIPYLQGMLYMSTPLGPGHSWWAKQN